MRDERAKQKLLEIRKALLLVSRVPNGPTVERPWVEPSDSKRRRRLDVSEVVLRANAAPTVAPR
jgi:hypothetical protein